MSFTETWEYPEGHPISPAQAREQLRGDLGKHNFEILARSCSPFYWHQPARAEQPSIRANGTLTYVRSDARMFGVTAAHVFKQYLHDAGEDGCQLQVGNAFLDLELIALDERLDLATVVLPDLWARQVSKDIMPISLPRPCDVPQEGRRIMLCGFVGEDRLERPGVRVDWGMLGVAGIARRVTEKQITWSPDHEAHIPVAGVPQLGRHKNLGGISGGPVIAWFEKAGGLLSYFTLAGIIVEANAALENVVAIRTEFIRPDGTLRSR